MSNRRQFVRSGVALAATVGFAPRLTALAQSDAATPAAATPAVPAGMSKLPLKNAGQSPSMRISRPTRPSSSTTIRPVARASKRRSTYAIAERLGFTTDQVTWGYTSFNTSYAPGPKDFDFYISEVRITEQRKRAVDFSDPYYGSPLVLVAKQDSPVFQAKTLAELEKYTYGAQVGTMYYSAITDYIKPEKDTLVFDTTADSLTALDNGQIDAVIQDLESANYITTEQFQGLAIAGQLPENPGQGTGLVFEKGSAPSHT